MNDTLVAHRLAARALIGHLLGVDAEALTIDPSGPVGGRSAAASTAPRSPWPLPRLLAEVSIAWTGHLAAARVGQVTHDPDLDALCEILSNNFGTTLSQAYISRGLWQADRLLRRPRIWAAVTQVAEVLLAERTLSPAQVAEVVHRALRHGTVVAGRRGSRRCPRFETRHRTFVPAGWGRSMRVSDDD
jgi:hypothetical protein